LRATVQELPNPYPSARRAWYAVAILTVAYILSFVDRQILSLLVAPIRRDLHITDTQMSLLMGLSFAFFYSIFGFPIGRLTDSRSRRNIITCGIVAWSFCTAGCGLASSYVRLFLMRVGVGVGEAALSPPAYSLLSDYFAANRRALALSVYGLGVFIGAGSAMILGGMIVSYTAPGHMVTLPLVGLSVFPWQLTFFMVGLPGLLVALFIRTIREPERRERASLRVPSIRATFDYVLEHRATFAYHHAATSIMAIALYGSLAWVPTFFIRDHGLTAGRTGLIYGLQVMIFSSLGVLAGGWLCDSLRRRGYRDAHFRVGLMACLLNLLPSALFPLMPSAHWAFVFTAPFTFLMATTLGVAPAALQQVAPNEMRGQVSAMYLFAVNIIGLAAGPTAIALVTDRVFHNDNAIGYSLLIVCTSAYALAALLWWLGLKPFRRSIEAAEAAVAVPA
jgi:MFS family permease